MPTDLVKVEGGMFSFSDLVFVKEIVIDKYRTLYTREDIKPFMQKLLFKRCQQNWINRGSQELREQRKKISLLIIQQNNLRTLYEEIINGVEWDLGIFLEKAKAVLPSRLIETEDYEPSVIPSDTSSVMIRMMRIKPAAISYLAQTEKGADFWMDAPYRGGRRLVGKGQIIAFFSKVMQYSDSNTDFDEYISDWARKLMLEMNAI